MLDLLVEHGKVDRREAERVNRLANETHEQIDILLTRLGLITEESNQHQYRFRDIVDPKNGKRRKRRCWNSSGNDSWTS